MKINAFLLILPVFSFFTPKETRSQQSTLHGVITVQNSQFDNGKVEYIAFAEVDECSQPRKGHALTDAQGQWRMELVGIAEKHPLLLKVKKEGYEVVNSDALQAIASQATPVRLHMATNKYITDAKRRYYNTGYTEAEKNLNKKLNAKTNELINLQKQTNADQNKIKALQEETALLQSQYEQLDSFARDLADKYARINLDDAGTLYQNVFRLFQAGDLEGAMQLWRNANLSGQVNNILEEEKRIGELKRVASERDSVKNRRKEELMQNLLLKVDAHQLRFEWDSVGITLREIVRLDTSNLNNLGQYTYFLYTQKQFPAAIAFLEKALATSNTPERRGDLLIKLGSFYGKMNEYVQEEKSLLEGVGIYRRLAQEKPDVFSFHLTQALHQLIFCYYSKEKYNNQDLLIEQTYLELLGIYRKLAVQNPGIHLFDLATTLRLLGSIYTNNKQNTLAEKYYLEALDVYREMARQMPDLYLGTLADALSDVSKYYRDNNQAQKSEELSGEALDVCGLWAERASVLKKPRSLIFLGKFYLNNAQFAEAEKMLMQAIDLVRKNNFQNAWELSSLASSITDLGNDFARAGKAEQAEKACEESIRIFRKLAMENQAAFLNELARSLEALSRIHRKNKQFSQATAEQEESLGLYRKLADINPDVFMPELASNLYRFGIFNDQPLQAEKALEESSDIYRKLARQNPDVFLPELAKTLRSLSKVNNKEKTWLEALEVARRLAQEKDSEVFIEDLASCLFEIMRYYGKNNGVDKAEKAGIESIDIYRKLADKNPDAFLKKLAFHLSYLAEFYRRHKINDKAEKFYIESVDMFRELAGKNPDDHLLRLARTLSDLGQFYEKNSQKAQAEKAYREAFDLYPKLDVKQLGWYDAGNLFEISKFFSPEDPLTTEKACRGAVNIYRNLEEQNPGEYTEDLISMLTNLGIFYMANGKSEDAEKVHSEAFSLYRKSHEGITDTFLTDLAYQLREFGYGYEEAQQYGPALKCYHKGLVTCHTNAKVKSDDFYFEWERLVSRVFEIQNKSFDSAQYDIAIRAALVLAESMDSMQRFDAQFKAVVVSEYVSLSWYYLFVRQYKESAYYAEKARSLDPAQNLARTNLGHSYLYRNDWKRAEQIYEEYLKNEKDLSEAKNILLKDWDDLEKAGLTHKSLVKAREWLNRQ